MKSYVSAEVPLSLEEIKEDKVIFHSIDQTGQLKYDAFEITIPNCEVKPELNDGDIAVFEAVFPKGGFANIKIPAPQIVRLMPSEKFIEGVDMTCAGASTTMPYPFWHPTFITVNQERMGKGIVFSEWMELDAGGYAQFHWESDLKDVDEEFTLQIREP